MIGEHAREARTGSDDQTVVPEEGEFDRTAGTSGSVAARGARMLARGGVLVALAFGLLAGLPAQALAYTVGDFEITTPGGTLMEGTDYSYDKTSHELSILSNKPITISMRDGVSETKTDRIVVPEVYIKSITLSGVHIDASGDQDACAFLVKPGAIANLTLAAGTENSLVSDGARAGLEVSRTGAAPDEKVASVAILGEGSLKARCGDGTGDANGAGIGGNFARSAGKIAVHGGTVEASCEAHGSGYANGAGIGGGNYGSGGEIKITGGEVSASCSCDRGGSSGAGIGGGYNGSAGKVEITGGTVDASCSGISGTFSGAGIGGSGGKIAISGGTVDARSSSTNGDASGAGIGSAEHPSNIVVEVSGGRVKAAADRGPAIGASAVITGGLFGKGDVGEGEVYGIAPAGGFHVFANTDGSTKDDYPVLVDFATGDFEVSGGTWGTDYSFDRSSRKLSILTDEPVTVSMRDGVTETKTDCIVVSEANKGADVTLSGVNIDLSADGGRAFLVEPGASAKVTLAAGTRNSLVSDGGSAGLEVSRAGSGPDELVASVAIGGEGFLEARSEGIDGDASAAGIGGGWGRSGGEVAISGGTVNASSSGGGTAYGAGIGGGYNGSAGKIEIVGGTVEASCSGDVSRGAGIGGGYNGSGGTVAISGGTVDASCSGEGSGAGIGNGNSGSGVAVKVFGGRVKAAGGSAIDGSVSITGGLFGEGDVGENKVYGVAPTGGFHVFANTNTSTKGDYPVLVDFATGDFKVSGGTQGTDYSFDPASRELSILSGTPVAVSMRDGVFETKTDRIVVPEANKAADVTLSGVRIDVSDDADACAFLVEPGASADLTLAEGTASSLVSGPNRAGLEASRTGAAPDEKMASVSIDGEGSLEARCEGAINDVLGAGIGGGFGGSGGRIKILGGTVNASCVGSEYSGARGAGIGGGWEGSAGEVEISGGTVSASCFSDSGLAWGAGIGGGESGSTGHVKVTGGEVNASCEGNVGYDRGAGIGNGVNGSGTAVEVSGGRVEAAGGSTIEESATVTGGLFGSGNVSDNEVYDVPVGAQDFPCAVIANPDALTAERYPFAVAEAKDYAPSLAPNGPLTYKGSALAASDFTLSATGTPPTEADLMAAAAFSHALQGSPLFEDGLPADAGSYVVKASLAKVVKGTEGSYVCYAALAPAETDVTINRKAVSPTSAAIGPKVYDGTVDAEVQEVSFDGPVDGESLALGEDYAATAAFEDAPAGEDKKVHVSVSLVADGPAAKNYVLKDGTGAFDAAGAITPSGASLGLSASDARPVYGDAIELSVTPDIKKDDANALEVSQPIVEFFVGEPGEGVKIGEAPVEEGKTAKVSLDTASKLLKAGGNVVCARVTGMQNLQDATERTVVTLMPKPVEASWSGVEGRIYGDGLLATAAVSGVLAGDDATSSVKGGDATAAGGPYTATVVLHGEDVGFYALSGATATARYSIARVPLSAQVAAGDPSATRAYDGTAAFAGVALALDGVLAGDEVFATAEGAADGALPAEGRAFSVTRIVLSGASAGNYELAPGNVTGTVSIVKARLAVRAKDASMTTGAALPAFGYEIEGLAAGDEVTVPPAFAVEGDTAVPGTCYVVPSGIEVTHADCYETVYERGLLAVSAAGGGGSTGGGAAGGPTGGPSALAPTGDPLSAALAAGALAALAGLSAVLVALRRRAPRRSS